MLRLIFFLFIQKLSTVNTYDAAEAPFTFYSPLFPVSHFMIYSLFRPLFSLLPPPPIQRCYFKIEHYKIFPLVLHGLWPGF